MLAKKRKVMESITTTTESSDALIESSPDTSRGLEETSNVEGDGGDNTYFDNENITDSNIRNFEMINNKEKKNVIFEDSSPFVDDLDQVRAKLKLKSAVRKKKVKLTRNRALTSAINSPFGDFTASISTDDGNEEEGGRRKRKNQNRVVEPDESIENMHFRIDDVDADDYDAMNRANEEEKENDGFNNSFSNENTELSETRNQPNKIPPTAGPTNQVVNQTLFNSLLKSNRLVNSTHLGNVQPITTLHLKMNMNENPDVEDEALDTMDVNSTIADLVQKIHQANGGICLFVF